MNHLICAQPNELYVQAGEMIKDALPGEELVIQYGEAYFEKQRDEIAHCLRDSLKACRLRRSLTATFSTTCMKLLQILEELMMVRPALLRSVPMPISSCHHSCSRVCRAASTSHALIHLGSV